MISDILRNDSHEGTRSAIKVQRDWYCGGGARETYHVYDTSFLRLVGYLGFIREGFALSLFIGLNVSTSFRSYIPIICGHIHQSIAYSDSGILRRKSLALIPLQIATLVMILFQYKR